MRLWIWGNVDATTNQNDIRLPSTKVWNFKSFEFICFKENGRSVPLLKIKDIIIRIVLYGVQIKKAVTFEGRGDYFCLAELKCVSLYTMEGHLLVMGKLYCSMRCTLLQY